MTVFSVFFRAPPQYEHARDREAGRTARAATEAAREKSSDSDRKIPYQRIFTLTCPILGALALVTRPKFELVKLPDGLPNWAWLNALKNSARI